MRSKEYVYIYTAMVNFYKIGTNVWWIFNKLTVNLILRTLKVYLHAHNGCKKR